MKKIYQSKITWMIVSLITSLILWVYVTSVESDTYTRTIRGIPVEFVGESLLHEKMLSIRDVSANTVTIDITGPRRTISALSSDDITAQINVSNVSQAAIASMQYTIKYPEGIDSSSISISRKMPETVTFTVSNMVTKAIPVIGSFNGSTAEGYTAEPVQFEPSTITVSGADVLVNEIEYAYVAFGSGEVDSTYTEEATFTLMNADKEVLDATNITCSQNTVIAKLPILKVKEVPIGVELIMGAGATEENTTVSVEPSSIRLAGDSNLINGLEKITLATIDLTSFESSYENTYTIVFDDTLINIDGITEAKVIVKIDGLSTKTFTVSSNNFTTINETEGYEATINSKSIDVVLRGSDEDLSKVKAEHIRAVVDLADFDVTEGSVLVVPNIYVDDTEGNSVGAVSTDKIQVVLRKVSK